MLFQSGKSIFILSLSSLLENAPVFVDLFQIILDFGATPRSGRGAEYVVLGF